MGNDNTTEKRAIMVGLDGAGKTTILYRLKLGEVRPSAPTIGFNVETVTFGDISMPVWDLGGQVKARPLWKHYLAGTNIVIYVVDCADEKRLAEAKTELDALLLEDELVGVPLLVFANKQDVPGAVKVTDLVNRFQLHDQRTRTWYVMGCSALQSQTELLEGVDWASDAVSDVNGRKAKAGDKKVRDFGVPADRECAIL